TYCSAMKTCSCLPSVPDPVSSFSVSCFLSTMHVALLTDADVFAGTERHILDLAAALRQLPGAPEVCIACPQPSPLAERAQKAGIPIVPVASSATGVLHWPTVFQLRDILKKGQIEILHAHNGRMALHAALAKFLARRGAL